MPPAAAIIGAGALGAVGSAVAGNQAAGATGDAANSSNATQLQMFNQSNALNAPWRQAGTGALNLLGGFLGVQNPNPAPVISADNSVEPVGGRPVGLGIGALGGRGRNGPSGVNQQPGPEFAPVSANDAFRTYLNSTGYQFQVDQGQNALTRTLAGGPGLGSGRALMAAQDYGRNAAQAYGIQPYLSQLQSLAGIGQSSSAQSGQNAIATGQGIANNTMNAGNARAGAYLNTGNALNNAISQGAGMYGAGMFGGGGGVTNFGYSPGGSIISDRRLKREVEIVGTHKGLNIYAYKYLWDDKQCYGYMADEVELVAPEAVSVDALGFKRVDYGLVH
jgi:hypothetical protein